ncbi:oxidoreductase [Emticicia aquatilis]|uniref:Oxidoreductase n=1 Tax=Emticicia aquatilis TaxID=1537369 RepID=A0A916YNB0_9BACT|nr:SDR family oxidoreductase [Emticicia aquatilis]GGD52857.1 oxidoreductase [Emticicia aquatilis]
MDLLLNNKKVLVSGSTTGIGYAIAKGFAKEGALVYLNGRSEKNVNDAVSRIKREISEAKVFGIAADLTTEEGFNSMVKEVPEVDILVNNLGIYEPVNFFESKDEDWLKMFNINVLSGIRLTRLYMPKMLTNNWGRVLFISSESAIQIPTEMIHYGMSKTAQLSIANGLAQLTKGTGVTVNSILPGPTFSDGVERFIGELAVQKNLTPKEVEHQFFAETRPLSLLQRFITPDEVASAVLYVSSQWAAATNGAAIRVDGGILKGIH